MSFTPDTSICLQPASRISVGVGVCMCACMRVCVCVRACVCVCAGGGVVCRQCLLTKLLCMSVLCVLMLAFNLSVKFVSLWLI